MDSVDKPTTFYMFLFCHWVHFKVLFFVLNNYIFTTVVQYPWTCMQFIINCTRINGYENNCTGVNGYENNCTGVKCVLTSHKYTRLSNHQCPDITK